MILTKHLNMNILGQQDDSVDKGTCCQTQDQSSSSMTDWSPHALCGTCVLILNEWLRTILRFSEHFADSSLILTLLLDLLLPPTNFMKRLYCSSWLERSLIFLISSSLFLLSSSSACFRWSSSFCLSCSFCCWSFFHALVCCFLNACLANQKETQKCQYKYVYTVN